MVHTLGNFDELLQDLSEVRYKGKDRSWKYFYPESAKFSLMPGAVEEDTYPFDRLREAHAQKAEIRVADFSNREITIGITFTSGMREYMFVTPSYVENGPQTLEITFPLHVLAGR